MSKGFSLLELLIALAIVGILCALAYPSYSNHVTKIRRIAATIALTDAAGRMEEYYALNNSYSGATIENLHINTENFQNYYKLTINSKDDTYAISAEPIITDVSCGTLILDQAGIRSITGSGTINDCW